MQYRLESTHVSENPAPKYSFDCLTYLHTFETQLHGLDNLSLGHWDNVVNQVADHRPCVASETAYESTVKALSSRYREHQTTTQYGTVPSNILLHPDLEGRLQ